MCWGFVETRYEWMVAFLGCAKYNLTVVTLYSTLSEEAVLHGIVESEASILVASADGLCKIKRIERERSSHNVSTIVWFPNQVPEVKQIKLNQDSLCHMFAIVLNVVLETKKILLSLSR